MSQPTATILQQNHAVAPKQQVSARLTRLSEEKLAL
jgi:hypothetical protein